MLSDAELTELLKGGESDRVEFTESAGDPDKIRKAACALANDLPGNKQPGVVFVGVKDDGGCAELNIDDPLLLKLSGLRDDGKILPFPVMEVAKKTLEGCEVAIVQVMPSDNPPIRMDGRSWIRVGPSARQATAEEERRLTEKRRLANQPYDMVGVQGTSIDRDLNMDRFRNEYLPSAVSSEAIEENRRGAVEQLRALRLIAQDGQPTVTAVLMLGENPQRWFPGAYIQFVRYDGVKVTAPVKDQIKLVGTLPVQLREMDKILQANITTALDTSDVTHTEHPDYPYPALRELVYNAVIHRDYDSSYTPVRVYWFTDRVEVSSPGGAYGRVTIENFAKGRTDYRNPTIAEVMKNMGFMQQFGMGIPTAREKLQANGNPPVQFDVNGTFVVATVKRK